MIENIVSEIRELPGTLVKKDAIIKIIAEFFNGVEYPVLEYNEFIVDRNSYTISFNGKRMQFPKKQLEIVYHLVKNVGRLVSRDELLRDIWGTNIIVGPRTVDVHIRRIREKIPTLPLKTIKCLGYKLQD
jgi:two-component system alkaline phosphatase synthesis response regulator PhoP